MGNMGNKATPQILICGPEKSGKTTLLYNAKKLRGAFTPTETVGFQYEEVPVSRGNNNSDSMTGGFWDVGGSEACMNVMQAITQNVKFHAILIVIDIT